MYIEIHVLQTASVHYRIYIPLYKSLQIYYPCFVKAFSFYVKLFQFGNM